MISHDGWRLRRRVQRVSFVLEQRQATFNAESDAGLVLFQ
jgi:hypothetical protein